MAVPDDGDVAVGGEESRSFRPVDPDALGARRADPPRAGQRGAEPAALVDEEVVEVEVPVHDLAAETLPLRQHALLVAVEHPRDERAPPWIRDLLEQRAQLRRGAEVPEQLTTRGRMEERAEREAEAG